jgi:hypothetical protein
MEVLKLNQDTYMADYLIQGYESMIWTERFSTNGEFKLKSARVEETRELLPLDSLISLQDTREIMIVENHEISEESGIEYLTVSGRTFDTFLEQRSIIGGREAWPKKESWKMLKSYKTVNAAALLIWNSVIDVNPVINGVNENSQGITYSGRSEDVIPAVRVSDTTYPGSLADEDPERWWLEPGPVYTRVREFLTKGDLGLRALRPNPKELTTAWYEAPFPIRSDAGGYLVRPRTGYSQNLREKVSFDNEGNPIRENIDDERWLWFDLYNGMDRSVGTVDKVTPVIFSDEDDVLSNAKYLWTKKDYKNVIYVDTKDASFVFTLPGVSASNLEGLDRRVLFLSLDKQRGDDEDADEYRDRIRQKARVHLRRRRNRFFFSSEISANAPLKYKVDYGLGDKITVQGRNGIQEDAFVEEYIRTDDKDGDRGYPTFTFK